MDSLGEFLKETRLKLNISMEQIVEDTHIVKKFIEAIEKDEFSAFPGETYLKGFLRSYSQYLGLDSDDIIRRYEKIKMMETPTPIEQLIPKPQTNFKPLIILSIVIIFLALIISGGYLLFKNISNSRNIATDNIKSNENKKTDTTLQPKTNYLAIEEDEKKFDKLRKGDIIEVGKDKHRVMIKELYPVVTLGYGDNKELILIQSYQQRVDLNDDGNIDVFITLNNWDNNFANITFKLNTTTFSSSTTDMGDNPEVIATTSSLQDGMDVLIRINNYLYLRHKVDNLDETEKYYASGSSVNLKIKEKAILWLTNSGAATLFVKNKEVPLGESGKVKVKMLSFRKNNNEYELVMSDLR